MIAFDVSFQFATSLKKLKYVTTSSTSIKKERMDKEMKCVEKETVDILRIMRRESLGRRRMQDNIGGEKEERAVRMERG